MTNNSTNLMPNKYMQNDLYLSLFRLLLANLYRIGTILVHMGSVPTENLHNPLLHYMQDYSAGIISFALCGYILAYGSYEVGGVLAVGKWIGAQHVDYHQAILGLSTLLVGSAPITLLLSGRVHIITSVTISATYASIILPIIIHWSWTDFGWTLHKHFLNTEVTFIDYGGAVIVHAVGGTIAFVGCLFLGRRLLLLTAIREGETPGAVFIGYSLMIFGVNANIIPRHSKDLSHVPRIITNSSITIGISIMVAIVIQNNFCKDRYSYWTLLRCLQSALAGLITTSSGADVYSIGETMIVTFLGVLFFAMWSKIIKVSALEDYCNTIAMFVCCGLLGGLIPHNFTCTNYIDIFKCFSWQIICITVILIYTTFVSTLIFIGLYAFKVLRNSSEANAHKRSKNLTRNKDIGCCKRIFSINRQNKLYVPETFRNGKNDKTIETHSSSATIEAKKLRSGSASFENEDFRRLQNLESSYEDFEKREQQVYQADRAFHFPKSHTSSNTIIKREMHDGDHIINLRDLLPDVK